MTKGQEGERKKKKKSVASDEDLETERTSDPHSEQVTPRDTDTTWKSRRYGRYRRGGVSRGDSRDFRSLERPGLGTGVVGMSVVNR